MSEPHAAHRYKRSLNHDAHLASILAYVTDFVAQHAYAPTIREIATACDINSTSFVATLLDELEDAGKLSRGNKRARSIVLTEPTPPCAGEMPRLTQETHLELLEALAELDTAFKPTAQSVNARAWVDAFWAWQRGSA